MIRKIFIFIFPEKSVMRPVKFVTLFLALFLLTSLSAAWWNDSFEYRTPINITENSGQELNDYQVELIVDTESLIAEGKMSDDCSDVRFANSSESELDYWIENGCNTASTTVWVQMNDIQASDREKIFMYHGNSEANSKSNPESTFTIYDDFNDNSLSSKWTAGRDDFSNYAQETNGELQISGSGSGGQYWKSSAWIQSSEPIGNASEGFVATVDSYAENNGARDQSYLMFYNDNTHAAAMTSSTEGSTHEAFTWEGGSVDVLHGRDGETWFSGDISSYSPQTYETIKMKWDAQEDTFYFYDDQGNQISRTVSWSNREFKLRLSSYARTSNGITGKFDNIEVRKYTSPSPTTSIGESQRGEICDRRGPLNECIIDQEHKVSGENFNVSNKLITESSSELYASPLFSRIKVTNTSRISGLWIGNFEITAKNIVLTSGAKFRPDDRITLNSKN